MTRDARSPRALLALAAALLAFAVGGCHASRRPAAAAPLTRQLHTLVSDINGLYYPPFLRDEPASAEDNSYAVRLRTLLGQLAQLSLPADAATSLRADALAASPLWGRAWLAPLAAAGVSDMLDDADIRAIHGMRTPGGWFAEPDHTASDDSGYRAAATATALEVLAARGGIDADDRTGTLRWVQAAAGARPSVREAADLAESLQLLGAPVPAEIAAMRAPAAPQFASLTPQQRYDALLDAYSYARIATSAGRPVHLSRTLWANVLRHDAASLGYRDLYYVTYVAKAVGVPASGFDAVRARIADATLPDGAVRDLTSAAGSPEATLYALRLRHMAGEPTEDPGQVNALRKAMNEHHGAGGHETLTEEAALYLAGDHSDRSGAAQLCRSASVVPATVDPDSVETWSRNALACTDLQVSTTAPHGGPWPLDKPDHVVAAATFVTGLADIGHPARQLSWMTADSLRAWVEDGSRLPTTSGYATTVRAYLLLGGHLDAQQLALLDQTVDDRKGCAALPSLYRADGAGSGCDFKATWAVWKVKAVLHQPTVDRRATGGDERGGRTRA